MIMSASEMRMFLNQIDRAEFDENPRVYAKAIRTTLIVLGYDDDWVNGEFRDNLEHTYNFYFEREN